MPLNHNSNHKIVPAAITTTFLTMFTLIMYPSLQGQALGTSSSNIVPNNAVYHETAFLNGGVRLLAIHTQPITVHVGNVFHKRGIVFNDSPSTISFIAGPCDSPLSTTFDKNVVVKHGIGCLIGTASATVHLVKLKPGGTASVAGPSIGTASVAGPSIGTTSVAGPSIGTTYQAVASGMTIASVTFHYQLENGGSGSVTNSFEFNIMP